jgi:hypothetical protein
MLILTLKENFFSAPSGQDWLIKRERVMALATDLPLFWALHYVKGYEKAFREFFGGKTVVEFSLLSVSEVSGQAKEEKYRAALEGAHVPLVEDLQQTAKQFEDDATPTALPAAGESLVAFREGNWPHPDGKGRIIGWHVPQDVVDRIGADSFCLPREIADALDRLTDPHRVEREAHEQIMLGFFHADGSARPEGRPQECAASGAGHNDGPHGPNGETQCAYCGLAP